MKSIFDGEQHWGLLKCDDKSYNELMKPQILFDIKLPFGYHFIKWAEVYHRKANVLRYNDGQVLKMADKLNLSVKIKNLDTKEISDYFTTTPKPEYRYTVYCENSQGFRVGSIEEVWYLYNKYKVDHFEAYGALKFCSLGYSSRKKSWVAFIDGHIKEFKCRKPADAKKKAVKFFMGYYIKSKIIHLL